MASWMVHLRIADILLRSISGLTAAEFIVGNIAPDSGVPNEDWTKFSPSTEVSHYRNRSIKGGKNIDISAYINRYFTKEQQKTYNKEQYSFYLGYLCHLLTDVAWSNEIVYPTAARYPAETKEERHKMILRFKEDWYDLDFLYLREHPDFSAFQIFKNAVGFENTYVSDFSSDAFDNRRAYIVQFYSQKNDNLDREYLYLSQEQYEQFVRDTSIQILDTLRSYRI